MNLLGWGPAPRQEIEGCSPGKVLRAGTAQRESPLGLQLGLKSLFLAVQKAGQGYTQSGA